MNNFKKFLIEKSLIVAIKYKLDLNVDDQYYF